MKKLTYILFLSMLMVVLASCEDMLKMDSSRYATVNQNGLASGNDSVSSVLGALTGMQSIAERYVILGEIRADLLDVTSTTPAAIRELSNFAVSAGNQYADTKDYYNIINNCNYFISKTGAGNSPLKKENALMRTIRAWVYMQVVFNWGEAYYYTEPILSVEDARKNYPLYTIEQVIDLLIADLEPIINVPYPNYGTMYLFESNQLFIPAKILLADLYLWRGSSVTDFEKAAEYYAEHIDAKTPVLNEDQIRNLVLPVIKWTSESFTIIDDKWSPTISAATDNNELVTAIQMAQYASEGIIYTLPFESASFTASEAVNTMWDNQIYLHYNTETFKTYITTGDLRKRANISQYDDATLTKIMDAQHLILYRLPLLQLRYAEALNRAGKTNTAFAVLKYGLSSKTLNENVTKSEWENVNYINIFSNDKFDTSIGIHSRGCGDASRDNTYVIGAGETLLTKQDTINWIENAICTELALETSFEGNRFQDLMRIAIRRNDNTFLADRIAVKNPDVHSLLLERKNWFLPRY